MTKVKKEREREGESERNGDASSFCCGVLRRTIKPCRLRGGVMGSPKVNLTAYDLLYLPSVVPFLSSRNCSLFSTLQRPSAFPLSTLPRGPLTHSSPLYRGANRTPTTSSYRYD